MEDQDLRDVILMLNAIMQPIAGRNAFMHSGTSDDGDLSEFAWVDSDGESDDNISDKELFPLTEDDMIALLDQVPFKQLFHSLRNDMMDRNVYRRMHGIVFADALVQTLCNGCRTYGSMQRYRNFVKRLGLLISHTVCYVDEAMRLLPSDPIEQIPENRTPANLIQIGPQRQFENEARLQVEYDQFIYHTARRLYEVRTVGLWQYLTQLPFERLSTRGVWGLYGAIRAAEFSGHGPAFTPDGANVSMRWKMLSFRDNDECYYTLQMLGCMAQARTVEKQFIRVVAVNFLELLTMMDAADTIQSQYVVDRLRDLVNHHPYTLSALLKALERYMDSTEDGKLMPPEIAAHIEKMLHHDNLPLRMWTLSEADVDLLLRWFAQYRPSAPSFQHLIASELLNHIYYGEKSGQLSVPREWQLKIVRTVVNVYCTVPKCTETDGAADLDKSFETRCMLLLLQLRVHAMDQSASDIQLTLLNPEIMLGLHFVKDMKDEPLLQFGLRTGCPVTSLAALLITTAGHWAPVFYQDGVELLRTVALDNLCAAIRCLELIVPLMVSPDVGLARNEKFIQVVGDLVKKDYSTRLNNRQIGRLEAMLVTQVSPYRRHRYLSQAVMVKFWTECILCSHSNVPVNETALGLLNHLAYTSIGDQHAWAEMRNLLTPLFKDPELVKPTKSCLNQLIQKIIPSESASMYTNMPLDNVALSLLAFEIEHVQLEVETGMWPMLLRLLNSKRSITLDAALAHVCNNLGLKRCPPGNMLVLYKQARLLTRLDFDHPLYPLLCQQFFTVLLTRIGAVGEDGPNASLFGAKERLLEAESMLTVELNKKFERAEMHYSSLPEECRPGSESIQCLQATYGQLRSTFKAFSTWLMDHQLDTLSVDEMQLLPPHYCLHQLAQACKGLLIGDPLACWLQAHWSDLQDAQRTATERWTRAFRCASQWSGPEPPPAATLVKRRNIPCLLETCNKSLPVVTMPLAASILTAMMMPYKKRVEHILTLLHIIDDHTQRRYWPTIKEFCRLKNALFTKTKLLYTNEKQLVREGVKCLFLCNGEGLVHIRVEVATRSAHVGQQLEGYRRDFPSTVEAAIYLPPLIMCHIAMVKMLWGSFFTDSKQQPLSEREERHRLPELRNLLQSVFKLLRANSADHMKFTVAHMIQRCLSPTLCPFGYDVVLELFTTTCAENQEPPSVVLEAINSNEIPVGSMQKLYSLLTGRPRTLERALFVRLFGEKFNFATWLCNQQVSPEEISQFLEHITVPLLTSDCQSIGSDEDNFSFFQVLTSHMVTLAHYNFPSHFCKVLQLMLGSLSTGNVVPTTMLLELVTSLRDRLDLPALSLDMEGAAVREAHRQFALANVTIAQQVLQPTMTLHVLETIANHFADQRLVAGPLAGLYQQHKMCVEELMLLLGTVAHAFIIQNTNGRFFQFDIILPKTFSMFEPWLVPYCVENSQSNVPDAISQPWTTDCEAWVPRMIQTLLHAIVTAIESFGSNSTSAVLRQVFDWYVSHFNSPLVMHNLLVELHQQLLWLPWEKLLPSSNLVVCFNNVLQRFVPECHQFIGAVFLRCRWVGIDSAWLDADPLQGAKTRAMLLLLCVKLGLEPSIRAHKLSSQAMVSVLQDIAGLPWHSLDVFGLEAALDWYTLTTDSSVVLRSPTSPDRELDAAILDLLEIACAMTSNEANPLRAGRCETEKRGLFIRTTVRQLVQVATATKKTVAIFNVKKQVGQAVQQLFDMIGYLLEASPDGEDLLQDLSETRLHDARGMLTTMVLGIRSAESVHQIFTTEAIRVLGVGSSSSQPLAQGILDVSKLFIKHTPVVMGLIETALFVFLNTPEQGQCGESSSWMRALELVGVNTVRGWQDDALVGEGYLLCMQLYFVEHWVHQTGASVSRPELLRQLLVLLKSSRKETHEYHLYPLWLTMIFAVFNLGPDTPNDTIHSFVESIGEYLLRITEQVQRNWIVEMVQTLIATKKTPPASQRIIALGLACCVSAAYRRLESDDDEGNAKSAASVSTGGNADDNAAKNDGDEDPSGDNVSTCSTTAMLADPAQAFRPLLGDPNLSGHREQIEELLTELQSNRLNIDATLQLAASIIEKFDPRARHILRTVVQALRSDKPEPSE
uniref:Uncharacterized protein n=1 Tax=Anopheles atroparvus TaxID=41427 RepID=A0AAG5DM92_ANOAO